MTITNDYKEKYLKYKQKYINLKNNLKGGTCNRCPILGFSQHYEECWHDSLSIIVMYSDGMCDIIQPIFENDIETIITQINKNIDENKIPDYYLPFNIDPSDKEFLKNEINQYVRQLYFRYHNESKEVALLDPLKENIKKYPFLRQPSLQCSLDSVKNIFNIANINNSNPKKYLETDHSGSLIHDLTTISVINYCFMNYNRSAIPKENKYIYQNCLYLYNPIIYEYNTREEFIEFFKKYIDNLDNIKKQLESNKINSIEISLSSDSSDMTHIQAFIKCKNEYYFYDNHGIDETTDTTINNRLVKFEWNSYIVSKIDKFIKEINKLVTTLPADKFNKNDINLYLNDITQEMSGFYYGHEDKQTYGKKYLRTFYIDQLNFNIIENEQNEIEYYKKFTSFIENYSLLSYTNNRCINFILSYINFDNNDIYNDRYFDKIITNKNYILLKEILYKYTNSINLILKYKDKLLNSYTFFYNDKNMYTEFLFLTKNIIDKDIGNNFININYYFKEIVSLYLNSQLSIYDLKIDKIDYVTLLEKYKIEEKIYKSLLYFIIGKDKNQKQINYDIVFQNAEKYSYEIFSNFLTLLLKQIINVYIKN